MLTDFTGNLLPQVEFHYDPNPTTSGLMGPPDALGSSPQKRSGGGGGGGEGRQE